jgi:peroxiredoxin Q/BCP
MKRSQLIGVAMMLFAAAASAALKDGDVAPNFRVQASLAGKAFEFELEAALERGPVVVYFYPSAFTRGCNLQAHTFAVNHDKFAAAGATVVGISLDDIATLKEFSADPEYCAGKLPVASDPAGKVARSYGLNVRDPVADKKDTRGLQITHGAAERTTFIVTADNRIASVIGGVSPTDNVERALAVVQRLAASKQAT